MKLRKKVMGVNSKQLVVLLLVVVLIVVASKAEPMSKVKCQTKCGSVTIPFPFGMSKECSLDTSFLITCNRTSSSSYTPFLKKDDVHVLNATFAYMEKNLNRRPVLNISLHGELHISFPVVSVCYNNSNRSEAGNETYNFDYNFYDLRPFHLSPMRNKLTVVGIDTAGVVVPFFLEGRNYTASMCFTGYRPDLVINGSCSGVGCCDTTTLQGLSNVLYGSVKKVFDHSYYNNLLLSYPCSRAFLVEDGAYNFSSTHLLNFPYTSFPVVLNWAVGNLTCQEARKNASTYACKSNHSECYNSKIGYLCNCSQGFEGNPYLSGSAACQDVDECTGGSHDCVYEAKCINSMGSYDCSCPEGFKGDGKKNGTRCSPKSKIILIVTLSVSIGILAILGVCLFVYWALKKRKLIKLKEIFFQQNGGLLFQHQISRYKGTIEMAKLFTVEELMKATNNFDKGKILGQGGHGTVYIGLLQGDKVVAIKKSNVNDPNQIKQFINEVIVLSQINHRNVVKLLGCCLETEVPLLVYEFIPNGTVFEHLHDQSQSLKLTWKTRLRIAQETAGALAYLHSATSVPIIHRDVKTANILLDCNMTAKVSDFGASRIFPLDQTQLTTLVQGTLGYLDPEYFHTSHLTEKSDVYSFGVVLAELLTRKKALSFNRSETDRNLGMYFVSSVKEGRLLHIVDNHIIHESNAEQLMEIANIAIGCLRVKGEERPTMKEVAIKLEEIRVEEKQRWKNSNSSLEETESLLNAAPSVFNVEDGIDGSGISCNYGSINQISTSLEAGR